MKPGRATIAGLMAAVAFVALAVAALRSATPVWAAAVHLLTLALLGVALLGTICRRGDARAGWLGASLFGWGYLFLAYGPWFTESISPRRATQPLMDDLYRLIHPASTPHAPDPSAPVPPDRRELTVPPSAFVGALESAAEAGHFESAGSYLELVDDYYDRLTPQERSRVEDWRPKIAYLLSGIKGAPAEFHQIGDYLTVILAAGLGGLVARVFRTRGEERAGTPTAPPRDEEPPS